MSNLSLENKSS